MFEYVICVLVRAVCCLLRGDCRLWLIVGCALVCGVCCLLCGDG